MIVSKIRYLPKIPAKIFAVLRERNSSQIFRCSAKIGVAYSPKHPSPMFRWAWHTSQLTHDSVY